MNAYLFTAGSTQIRVVPTPSRGGQLVNMPQSWDGTTSAIVYGGTTEQAQRCFEAWCCPPVGGENTSIVKIKKLVVAQFVDELLTESGGTPPDWPQLSRQIFDALQTTAVDDFEQGYWVDVNEALPPGKISPDIESLQRGLPEDIRSGLNWSAEKQFYFIVSVFCPRPEPVFPAEEADPGRPDVSIPEGGSREEENPDLDAEVAARPELQNKETAAMVMARNSVAAAWLWRKYAASTPLATNDIKIDPCCSFVPVE